MSFETIEKQLHNGTLAKGVAISASVRSPKISTRIRFAPDVLDAMNWYPGCRLGLAHGKGRDAGKLRIGPDDLNGFKLLNGGSTDKSKFLYCACIGDGKLHRRQLTPHTIHNGYLYIDLPDWAVP